MFSVHYLIAIVLAVSLTNIATARHIKKGNVIAEGQVENSEGRSRHYSSKVVRNTPSVDWRNLARSGITASICNEREIQFIGNIDPNDFQKGFVLEFPIADYKALGCPLSPLAKGRRDTTEIFRMIDSVLLEEGKATVYTSFIDNETPVLTNVKHPEPVKEPEPVTQPELVNPEA